MATFYNKFITNLNTSDIVGFTSSSDSTIVLSVLVANNTSSSTSDVTVKQVNASDTLDSFLAKTITVPANSNLDILSNKYILPSGKKLSFSSSSSGTVDVTISYVEV